MVVSKYIHGDFDVHDAITWATEHCPSFLTYKLVELGWEEKTERNCWFRIDVHFRDEKDAMFFSLKWL